MLRIVQHGGDTMNGQSYHAVVLQTFTDRRFELRWCCEDCRAPMRRYRETIYASGSLLTFSNAADRDEAVLELNTRARARVVAAQADMEAEA